MSQTGGWEGGATPSNVARKGFGETGMGLVSWRAVTATFLQKIIDSRLCFLLIDPRNSVIPSHAQRIPLLCRLEGLNLAVAGRLRINDLLTVLQVIGWLTAGKAATAYPHYSHNAFL